MKKKFLKTALVVFMLTITITNIVRAISFTVTLTPSKTTAPEEDTVIVVLKITNIDAGSSEGFSEVTGTLTYDTSVFEAITQSDFERLNNWKPVYDAGTNKLTLTSTIAAKTDTSICQITFNTKQGITSEAKKSVATKIQFTDIVGKTEDQDKTASDIATTITIVADDYDPSANNLNNTNSNMVLNVNNNVNKNVNNVISYVENVNKSDEDISQAGAEDTALILLIIAIAVSIGFYIKFEKSSWIQ